MNIAPTTTMPTSQNSAEMGNTQKASQQKNPRLKQFIQFKPAFGQSAGRIIFAESNPDRNIFKSKPNFKS
ncbi:hypothetical protein [Pseudomonas gessardii]|uniref:Uncharacterized protein n=1 Tax=Pseudomonas gessardii TaxID=78544 RepID=A0A7Y1QN85_9PSED|nr:hypothetical protein [Pseudomonas gessardii]NNA97890.1 hypothetical protein [Pseudomonas gessardii]